MYSCDDKAELLAAITLIFNVYPSEIILICWFLAQKIFLLIIDDENSCAA